MTDEATLSAVEGALRKHAEVTGDKIEGLAAKFQEFEQNALTGLHGMSYSAPSTPGSIIVRSERVQALRDGMKHSGRIGLGELSCKDLTSLQGSTTSPAEGVNVVPSEAAGLWGVGRRPLRLLDLIPRIATSSNSVRYTRLTGFSNAAAVQAGEGAVKATQTLTPSTIDAPIQTIAVTSKMSKQVLDDTPFLESALDSLFRFNLLDRLEAQIVAGDGTGSNLDGFESAGTAISGPSGEAQPDQVGDAIATMIAAGYAPDYLLVNPNDFQGWRAQRSTTNEYIAGHWSNPNPPVMWGIPAVLSPSVTSGKVVLAHNASHALLDRQDPAVEIFETNSDDVETNMLTLRAELRAGIAIMDPQGVRVLSLV